MGLLNQLKSGLVDWFEERLKVSTFSKILSKKVVPQHEHTFWYYFGGMALFLFIMQIITGLLLMVYYQPGLETSYESVKFIIEKVEYGRLIRSIHSWAANLMVAVVFIHMFCAYFMKAYRKPRELTWLTGMGLFALSLGMGFSGYLLTWDELAYFATKVGLQIMEQTPLVGPAMADLLRGGSDLSGATISRFFELHIILMPLAMMGLLGAHLLLVQLHGMSTPYSYANKPKRLRKSIPFFSDFLFHDIFIWTLMLGAIIAIAHFYPWELGPKADPWAPAPEGIKPEWYFMFMFQILKLLPAHIGPIEGEVFGIVAFGVAGAVWALVPFWGPINKWTNKLATFYGVSAVMVISIATISGYMKSPEPPLVPSSGSAPAVTAVGQANDKIAQTFQQNCAACHSIGKGPLAGPDLKDITKGRDREQLADFIVDPSGSAMPQIPGIDKATALALLTFIESESNPAAKKDAEKSAAPEAAAPQDVPFTQQDIENGRQLFLGLRSFAKGGSACIACHDTKNIKGVVGGTLGPDLTTVYDKLGQRQGLSAWLSTIPSKTMKPIYESHPLDETEIKALTAFLADASQQAQAQQADAKPSESEQPLRLTRNKFVVFGFLGLILVMVTMGVLYHNRFRSVRRMMVDGTDEIKEHEADETE